MIYLVCHSGYLNYGDELIAKTWLDFLTQTFPLEEIWVDTCNPGMSAILFREYRSIRFTDTLWLASQNSIGKNIDYMLDLSFIGDGGTRFNNGLEIIKAARYVHLVGGGYMNSELPFNYSILAMLAHINKTHPVNIIATGLGLEPMDEKYNQFVGEYLKSFSWIDVRDQESFERLKSWGLGHKSSFTCDDVFLAPPKKHVSNRAGKLFLSAQQGENPFLVVSFLLKLIESCPQAENGIEFLVLDADSDMHVARKLVAVSNRKDIVIRDFDDLWKNGLDAGPGDFVFSTRFHAHLVTSSQGAHGLCASISIPYYDVKHLSLIRMGSGFGIIGMHDFSFDYEWHKERSTFADCAHELRLEKLAIVERAYGLEMQDTNSNDNAPVIEPEEDLVL